MPFTRSEEESTKNEDDITARQQPMGQKRSSDEAETAGTSAGIAHIKQTMPPALEQLDVLQRTQAHVMYNTNRYAKSMAYHVCLLRDPL
jgi:hypothetical protein